MGQTTKTEKIAATKSGTTASAELPALAFFLGIGAIVLAI